MINQIFGFFPRTWRKRSETAASEAASIETRLQHLAPSTESFLRLGFPQDAALDAALQLSGITNVESVLRRFSPEDIRRVVATIDESEALRPAIHATRFASSQPIKNLLTKIIKGELESPATPPGWLQSCIRIGRGSSRFFSNCVECCGKTAVTLGPITALKSTACKTYIATLT